MPFIGFLFLPLEPLRMLALQFIDLFIKFVDGSLVEAQHLLNLEVEGLNLLVFLDNCVLEVSLFLHESLHVNVAVLHDLMVGNMSQGCFGCVTLNRFLTLPNHIFHFSLNAIMVDCNFSESQLVLFPLIQSILNFPSQLFSGVFELTAKVLRLIGMICIAVLEFVFETVEISFIELTYLNFV